jgi:Ni,Fe-hydrogenase III small subunit
MKKNTDKTNNLIAMPFKSVAIKNPLKMDDTIATNYRGYVILDPNKDFILNDETGKILENSCPTHAITYQNDDNPKICLDNGKCILCGNCQVKSPELIKITNKFDLAKKRRDDLIETFSMSVPFEKTYEELGKELKNKIDKIFGRSLAIREIDAGSCNGCEIEINALNNPVYDIERYGITFVASPRHADVLLVTGPASKNMERALKIAYDSTPNPKIVIAVGACACSGGIFGNNYATTGGIDNIVPVNVYIPGCPPRPQALLYGILMAINKI